MISVVLDLLDCWVLKCDNFDDFGRVFDECALAQSYKSCFRAREGHVARGITKSVINHVFGGPLLSGAKVEQFRSFRSHFR